MAEGLLESEAGGTGKNVLTTGAAFADVRYLSLAVALFGLFLLLKRLSPIILSFVFIIFPVFAVIIGAWYEGQTLSRELMMYSAILLTGFAITKLPIEKWLTRLL